MSQNSAFSNDDAYFFDNGLAIEARAFSPPVKQEEDDESIEKEARNTPSLLSNPDQALFHPLRAKRKVMIEIGESEPNSEKADDVLDAEPSKVTKTEKAVPEWVAMFEKIDEEDAEEEETKLAYDAVPVTVPELMAWLDKVRNYTIDVELGVPEETRVERHGSMAYNLEKVRGLIARMQVCVSQEWPAVVRTLGWVNGLDGSHPYPVDLPA